MKTLEEEAKEYKDKKLPDDLYDGFIAGANSKWVEVEKIKSQIEILNKLQVQFQDGIGFEVFESYMEPLQQKLKELEDEK